MNDKVKSGMVNFGTGAFMPKEEQLETLIRNRKITIGIPSDSKNDEKRVALTPEAVGLLVEKDNEVIVQKDAGKGANYFDKDYSDNGALITDSPSEVYSADIVIKVAPISDKEADFLKGSQVIMTYLNILKMNQDVLKKLMYKKVTAIAFEKIRDNNVMPVVESMSEICGINSILVASEYMSSMHGGKGVMLGGITGIAPTEVVILGANAAGESAARAALGLGAVVKIFDDSFSNLRKIQNNIGQRLHTSVFYPQALKNALKSADVLVGAIELEDLKPWYYVTDDMVKTMKKGAVIIDLSIDRGGCIETTECRTLRDPVFEKYGVIHFSAWNLPSRVARSASIALNNIFTPLLQNMADAGSITQFLKSNQGVRNGVYIYNGILTNETLGQKFGIISKDLDLLISVF